MGFTPNRYEGRRLTVRQAFVFFGFPNLYSWPRCFYCHVRTSFVRYIPRITLPLLDAYLLTATHPYWLSIRH